MSKIKTITTVVIISIIVISVNISCNKAEKSPCTCRWQVATIDGSKLDSKTFPDRNKCNDDNEHEGQPVVGEDANISETKGGLYILTCQ
ncbi:MAG: hypothetical protein ACRC9X_07185 [Bacteroidales bacterium]